MRTRHSDWLKTCRRTCAFHIYLRQTPHPVHLSDIYQEMLRAELSSDSIMAAVSPRGLGVRDVTFQGSLIEEIEQCISAKLVH